MMPLRTLDQGDTETNAIIDFLLIGDGLAADEQTAATYRAGMSNAQIEDYLRSKTAEQISQAALGGPGLGIAMPAPTGFMDGTVLPGTSWLDSITSGSFKKVPLIIGNVQYEFKDLMTLGAAAIKLFVGVPSGNYSWNDLYNVLDGTLSLDTVLPTDNDNLEYDQTGLLKTREWQAECNAIARAIKTNDSANTVYSYLFSWTGGGDPALADFAFIFGASHAQDIAFFFGESTDLFKGYSFTAANKTGRVALQGAMMDYLTSYVKTGDPNPSGSALPTWMQWSNTDGDPKYITFDADLNNLLVSMDTAEATQAIVNWEIFLIVTAHQDFVPLFTFPGIQILPLAP
jgi:para-nitrobenzyl esterase